MIRFSDHALKRLQERFGCDEDRSLVISNAICQAIQRGQGIPNGGSRDGRECLLVECEGERVHVIVDDKVVVTVLSAQTSTLRRRGERRSRSMSLNNHQCRRGTSRRRRNAKRKYG